MHFLFFSTNHWITYIYGSCGLEKPGEIGEFLHFSGLEFMKMNSYFIQIIYLFIYLVVNVASFISQSVFIHLFFKFLFIFSLPTVHAHLLLAVPPGV